MASVIPKVRFSTRVCKRLDLEVGGGEYAWFTVFSATSCLSFSDTVCTAISQAGSRVVGERVASLGLNKCPGATLYLGQPLSFQLPDDTGDKERPIGLHISLVPGSGFDVESLSKLKALSIDLGEALFAELQMRSVVYWSTLSEWDPGSSRRVQRSVAEMRRRPRFMALHTQVRQRGTELQVGLIVVKGDICIFDQSGEMITSASGVHITLAAQWLLCEEGDLADADSVCVLPTGDNPLDLEDESELIAAIAAAMNEKLGHSRAADTENMRDVSIVPT